MTVKELITQGKELADSCGYTAQKGIAYGLFAIALAISQFNEKNK